MNQGQRVGMVAIVAGFIITIIFGLALSFLANDVLSPLQVIMAGVVAFVIVAPLFGYGIYTYARSTQSGALATNEEMEKPRLLLDILRQQEHADVYVLAAELQTTPEAIRQYITDLSDLSLFSGIADWDNGVIAIVEPVVVQSIESCRTCETPVQITGTVTICPQCATEYYVSDAI